MQASTPSSAMADPSTLPTPGVGDARSSRLQIFLLMLLVVALTNLPHIIAWSLSTPEHRFAGALTNNTDLLSYHTKMRQGYDGAWLYTNRYTPEPTRPMLLFTFYLLLGHVARWVGCGIPAMYTLARIGCGVALMFSVARLLRLMELRGRVPALAFALAFLAGGLGWMQGLPLPGGPLDFRPVETWVIEGFAFQSMANFPHFALGTALIVASLCELLLHVEGPSRPWPLVRLALWSFLLAWVHPRLLLIVVGTGAAAAVADLRESPARARRWAAALGCVLLASVPPCVLIVASLRADPMGVRWASTPTLSVPLIEYFEAYGLLWPLAVWGCRVAWRSGRPWARLVGCWMVVGAILPYIPTDSQRRFIQGLNIPIAILAAVAVADLAARLRRGSGVALILAVLVLSLSTITYLRKEIAWVGRGGHPIYYSNDRADAMDWLNKNTGRDEVVLASLRSGIFIPPLSGNRTVLGHWAESLDASAKSREIKEFFNAATSPEARDALLTRYHVAYLLYSDCERELGGYDPARDTARWREAWRSGNVLIFRRV